MQVLHLDAHLAEVVSEILGHLLGERRDDGSLAPLNAGVELREQVIDLALGLADFDLRVDEARRPDDLLDDLGGMLELVRARRRRDVDGLIETLLELGKCEGPVVERTRQTETVIDENFLPRAIAEVHAADLRHRDV